MRYVRSGDFIIHAMAGWWLLCLVAATTPLNVYVAPSSTVIVLFALFVGCFCLGHAVLSLFRTAAQRHKLAAPMPAYKVSLQLRLSIFALSFACLTVVLLALHLSGALREPFLEYYLKLRREETLGDSLTGSRMFDLVTKIIVFPVVYSLISVILALRIDRFRWPLLCCIVTLLLFSYLWQANYPLIHLFWFFVLYILIEVARGSALNKVSVAFVLFLVIALTLAATTRFGGDVLGALQRYFFGYHTAGFAFFDHHFNQPDSILHDHTLGRSSLGLLEQMLEIGSRRLGLDFLAASSENAMLTNESVDLGASEVILGNAFGTFLFGLYRDFNLVGVALGGLVYGAVVTYLMARSPSSWAGAALFYVLASAWMVGMMVNPIEQPHFWFSILFILAFAIFNRRWRL